MEAQTIIDVQNEIENAINEAFKLAFEKSRGNFVALIGFGEKQSMQSDCCDNKSDEISSYRFGDKSDYLFVTDRIEFVSNYLNKHYKDNCFLYQGSEGKDCISIELMIYTLIWESYFYLKSLVRLSQLAIGNEYKWELNIPNEGKWSFLYNNVIKPLQDNNLLLGTVVQQSFSSDLRNSFAHSMFRIDESISIIEYWSKRWKECHLISFEDFQMKFFKSAYLSLCLHNRIIEYQNQLIVQDFSYESIEIEGKKAYIRVIKINGVNVFDLKFDDNRQLYL